VRYGQPQRARRAAIMSLPKLAADRRTRETLELLLDDPDPILRIDVVRALGEMGDTKARPALRERLEVDLDARVRRRIREILRDLAEPRRATDAVRDDLDKLQGEHADLKARLAKLEARLTDAPNGAGAAKAVEGNGTAEGAAARGDAARSGAAKGSAVSAKPSPARAPAGRRKATGSARKKKR
jgi:aminopeptidase N